MSPEEKDIAAETQRKPAGPPKSTAREYFESFVVTLIMALFGMTFILQAVTVPTGSGNSAKSYLVSRPRACPACSVIFRRQFRTRRSI